MQMKFIPKASKTQVRSEEEEPILEYHDMEEPQGPIETPLEIIPTRR